MDSAYEVSRLGHWGRAVELLDLAEENIDDVRKKGFVEDHEYSHIKEAMAKARSLAHEGKDWESEYLGLLDTLDIAEGRVFVKILAPST